MSKEVRDEIDGNRCRVVSLSAANGRDKLGCGRTDGGDQRASGKSGEGAGENPPPMRGHDAFRQQKQAQRRRRFALLPSARGNHAQARSEEGREKQFVV